MNNKQLRAEQAIFRPATGLKWVRREKLTSGKRFRCMNKGLNRNLLGLELQELTRLTEETDEPAYRARQLFRALYVERASSIEDVSSLPKDFRSRLRSEGFTLGLPEIANQFVSTDGTVRYLMKLADKIGRAHV